MEAKGGGAIVPMRKGPPKGPEKKGKSVREKEREKANKKKAAKQKEASIIKEMAELMSAQPEVSPNTGIIGPTRPFKRDVTRRTLESLVIASIEGFKYSKQAALDLAQQLVANILQEVRWLGFNRHKLVCTVDVVENSGQEYLSIAKYLWNLKYDDYAHYSHRTTDFIITASAFGFYYD